MMQSSDQIQRYAQSIRGMIGTGFPQWIGNRNVSYPSFGLYTVLGVLFLSINLKMMPFAWHLRVIKRTWSPATGHFGTEPGSVFKQVVTRSRVSLLETDYNMHKSNSTFFSDLDVARTELLAVLRAEANRGGILKEYKKGVAVILAGASCSFKKEMKPGAAFDMHSRVLTWDKKWLYVVTYFVQKDRKARNYTFQPWKASENNEDGSKRPIVYATAISKCVVKCGRLTVPPEKFLRAANLLAPEAEGQLEPAAEEDEAKDGAVPGPGLWNETSSWSWKKVEEERLRALEWAEGLSAGLDMAHNEFGGLV